MVVTRGPRRTGSSQYAVAVGGTALWSHADGIYQGEYAWAAGGGGISQFEYSPYWEQSVQPVAQNVQPMRGTPDVAMDAATEPPALLWGGNAVNGACTPCIISGTSLASPLAAGVYARLQTIRGNRMGFAPPILYNNFTTHTAGAVVDGSPVWAASTSRR
jgi:pseudomonalisin